MMICLTVADVAQLSAKTQAELLGLMKSSLKLSDVSSLVGHPEKADFDGIDMEDVHDLTPRQVAVWMEAASEKTKAGVRVFAEKGPVVTAAEVRAAGVDNLAHFQSRTTVRTRTVTGDRTAYLVGWDDWSEVAEGLGRYAVTPMTYESLRTYFQLD